MSFSLTRYFTCIQVIQSMHSTLATGCGTMAEHVSSNHKQACSTHGWVNATKREKTTFRNYYFWLHTHFLFWLIHSPALILRQTMKRRFYSYHMQLLYICTSVPQSGLTPRLIRWKLDKKWMTASNRLLPFSAKGEVVWSQIVIDYFSISALLWYITLLVAYPYSQFFLLLLR